MRGQELGPRDIADLALQLPRGSRVAMVVGGAWAWTPEVEAELMTQHLMQLIWHRYTRSKKRDPQPPEPPKGRLVEQAEAAQQEARWNERARRWKERNAGRMQQLEAAAARF